MTRPTISTPRRPIPGNRVRDNVGVYCGSALARYGFGDGHPFGLDRYAAFEREFKRRQLESRVRLTAPVSAAPDVLRVFHTDEYLERLAHGSRSGSGFLDYGDTPAFRGVLEASLVVAGSVLDGVDRIMGGEIQRAFVPIAGLHHARRDRAAGFCAINDCGLAIEVLKQKFGLTRIAYVDIDAHHGDGVFYAYEADPAVINVDFHEDGVYLYPGTGREEETGKGPAEGLKLNVPLPPGADDALFWRLCPRAQALLDRFEPEFFILQAGADSLAGDPLTHLSLTSGTHARVARSLAALADRHCGGRLLALGGGGYNRTNLAEAWCRVVEALGGADT